MKQFLLFILIFITIKFIGVVEPIPTGDVYHGNQRYWTLEANENTYLALHVLKESIKLVFPKEKTIGELLSGLKLYSPSENGKCEDTIGSLDFTLVIDVQNHIRGAAFVDTFNNIRTVKTHLFEKCGSNEQSYASPPIDVNPTPLEDRSRQCFQSTVPFQVYDNIKHVMELQVSGTFQCQVFMELPSYMKIENVKLPEYKKIGLNETFLGHDETFWWKTGTDKMLPSAVSFDSNRNVKLDVLKSTKMIPYFFRIGSGQPIPSMKFIFGSNCNDAKFELFANLRDSSDCKIGITLIQDGYEILTKNGVLRKIKDSTKSPTLIFGENQVYVKVASPLSINEFETCQLRNTPDVPADQFVLQLGPPENIATCDKAEIILHHSDVVNGIEVLIDRSKIPVPIIALNETSDNSTNSSSPDGETASAAFEWWWWLIAGILLVLVLVIVAVLIYMFCYRRGWCCKKQKKTKSPKIQLSSIENEQELVTRKTATAKSPTISTKEVEKKKKLLKLKFYSMYGIDGFTKINEPFNYHQNETCEFKATINFEQFGTWKIPNYKLCLNFWKLFSKYFASPGNDSVYVDVNYLLHDNIYFIFRDLVADNGKEYSPFCKLSNRILEPPKSDNLPFGNAPPPETNRKKGCKLTLKEVKNVWFFYLRVFITSYNPLTIEIHCRGPWPQFVFELFGCKDCVNILKCFQGSEWTESPVTSFEDWQTFLCRIKRTPINSHQFLSFNNLDGYPEDPNDVNHILVIRGENNCDQLRPCSRKCMISNFSHANTFPLSTSFEPSTRTTTMATQDTQPSI